MSEPDKTPGDPELRTRLESLSAALRQTEKAEEAKVKAAETAKTEAEQLAKAQDRVAEAYIKEQKAKGVIVKPTPIAPPAPPAAGAAAPVAAAAPAAGPTPEAKK